MAKNTPATPMTWSYTETKVISPAPSPSKKEKEKAKSEPTPAPKRILDWDYCECGCHQSTVDLAGFSASVFIELDAQYHVRGARLSVPSHSYSTTYHRTADEAYAAGEELILTALRKQLTAVLKPQDGPRNTQLARFLLAVVRQAMEE